MGMPCTLLGHAENVRKCTDANLDFCACFPQRGKGIVRNINGMKSSIFFAQMIGKYMKNSLVIMYSRYGEHILALCWPFRYIKVALYLIEGF